MKTLLIILLSLVLLSCGNPDRKIKEVEKDTLVNGLVKQIENTEVLKDSTNIKDKLNDTIGDCQKCNIQYIVDLEKEIQNPSEEKVYLFFCTFSTLCDNNAEFGEYSNEVLFKLLEVAPRTFIDILVKNKNRINIKLILNELSSPISDLINIDLIKRNIIDIKNIDEEMKETVIRALPETNYYD